MPRSPLSPPVGKRMRTMDDTDESDDEDLMRVIHLPTYRRRPRNLVPVDNDEEPPAQDPFSLALEFSRNEARQREEHERMIENYNNRVLREEDEDDDYTDSDDIEDDDNDLDDYEDLDDIEYDSNYSQDSLISGFDADLIYIHQGYEVDVDLDDEDDYIDYDSEDGDEIDHSQPDEYLKHDPTPETQYPKPEWITIKELRQRKYGLSSSTSQIARRPNMYWFERYVNNSLWMIQRLELRKENILEEHTGCVRSLDFNGLGDLLCSGSDDLAVCIWDWQSSKLRKKINTGHNNNVFDSQFCESDTNIVTASRDGTVRLVNIENGLSKQLMLQSGEISKIAFITPKTLVTCGTNACVSFIDLRIREPTQLFVVRNPRNHRSCALHTINTHPLDNHKIVVGGASPYVFLYDLRRVARNLNEVEHKPTHCLNNYDNSYSMVTSTAFNSNGDKLLISYNDDDLYVCQTDSLEIVHRYRGHRNKKTIKGCTWFGDNFVLSGSDDGHIYGWDLQSEHIVCFLKGDDRGIVNRFAVHPKIPVLASSGLDHSVKIWEPTSTTWPQTLRGIKPQICKNTMRRKRAQERHNLRNDGSDSEL